MSRTSISNPAELSVVGIDIGKDVFHITGFDPAGTVVLRRKVKRLALVATFEKFPRCIVGLYEDWLWLDERIESITSEIEKVSLTESNCERLMSVPGIGPMISTATVAAIGTGEAFDRGRDFGAWLGLVPRQYCTGGKAILGRISKRGSQYLRSLFVHAAQIILMRPHNWEKFSFGPWLTSERMHKNKLAVALANKLARITWSILRHERKFDFHQLAATSI